jgi:hypothetical protein
MKNIYYTYAYLREDRTPYYIGKGKENRAYKKHNVETPPKNRILFLKQNLTESEAFAHEIYMISVLGRIDLGTGILKNKNAGGNGSSGKVYSQEERNKIRNDVLGRKWWNNGIENSQSKKCPGDGWVLGRIITWDENERLKKMNLGIPKQIYKFTHQSGEIVFCITLLNITKKLNTDCFYKLLYKKQKFYKGWISVEKYEENDNVKIDEQRIINLCNSYVPKTYKITHKDGSVMYTHNLFHLGKQYGSRDGFSRIMRGFRKSYKGWIKVEII